MKQNLEQLEAYQADTNKKQAKYYKGLSDEDKKKVDAIGKAMDILTEANVPTIMFCQAPNHGLEKISNKTEKRMRQSQYNNWSQLTGVLKDLKHTEETEKKIFEFNMGFDWCVYFYYIYKFDEANPDDKDLDWWEKVNICLSNSMEHLVKLNKKK